MKLEVKDLCAAYGKKSVLEDISFTLEGGVTALLGRNGAGKTTLVSCILGQKRDHDGTLLLDGRRIRSIPPGERSRMVGCLPQMLPAPRVTVEELAAFGRAPYLPLSGKLSPADRDAVAQALEAVGMTALRSALVDTLSGGELKKAFFALVLAQDTPLVVLDEPTAHLDAASRFAFLELVRRHTEKTFLVVMHELPEALRFADRLLVLEDCHLVFDGTPEACLEAGIPERCFGVRVTGSRETGYAVVLKQE